MALVFGIAVFKLGRVRRHLSFKVRSLLTGFRQLVIAERLVAGL